ncbi:hypothetical protein [Streptomyces iconiensis]|uniref:Uncharacterized protein n=1 Tax=Streptomyces iconiensis TaxID=1384038 RepID=A0ABT7A4V2_9ACTN|nr:hypothetical protein [Streptomyces iconiensis]MDJ1136077.1 hypothetical protein [Streptomyces iconiensis]
MPSPPHLLTRVPRPARIVAAALLALAVLAGVLIATGALGRWTGAVQDASGKVCGGAVSAGDSAGLLGGDDVREGKKPGPESSGELARCALERGGASVVFRIDWSARPALPMKALGRTGPLRPPAVPVGRGWDGVVLPENGNSAKAAVVLACADSRKKHRGLVVTADAFRSGTGLRTPERAGQLAEAVTRAVRGAAEKWGCEAEFGKSVERVRVPQAVWPETVPVDTARGACRPLASMAADLRERAGVAGAVESPTGEAPLTDCQLTDAKGESVYWLTTYHGPFVRGESSVLDSGTATFACPRYHGSGLTALRALGDVDGDASLRRALLRAYTERAATAYGCAKPEYRD